MTQTTEHAAHVSLDQDELDRRSAVLRRLREHFLAQRNRFQDYLSLLDEEKDSIERGDGRLLERQVEMESTIVGEIYAFQKVIDPLEQLYSELVVPSSVPEAEEDIPALRDSLSKLRDKVLLSNERNQQLLKERMTEIQGSIEQIRIPSRKGSPYGASDAPSMIDLGA